MANDKTGKKGSGVIIRKTEIIEAGHHGGAWKVAYADFVTAMMAFFLLMWLLNATTEEQRKGLADYFTPSNLMSHASSGTCQPFGGHTPFDPGTLMSDRGAVAIIAGKLPERPPSDAEAGGEDEAPPKPGTQAGMAAQTGEAGLKAERLREEKAAFEAAAQQIRAAVQNDPALAELARQLAIDMTPEGLRIQIMDDVKSPMFAIGSAEPNERARLLLRKIVPILAQLPEAVSIAGHTDAAPFPGPGRSNWELSAERANATRRLLIEGGLAEARIRSVTGHADKDPLLPGDPLAPANRRIAIVVLRDAAARH